jgi:hypothetical protein
MVINFTLPTYAQNIKNNKFITDYNSKSTIDNYRFSSETSKISVKGQSKFRIKSLNTQIKFKIYDKDKLALDNSRIEKKIGENTFGIGSLDRNWSFSPRTSLIMSSNARPFNSVYFNYNHNNQSNMGQLKPIKKLSFEIFNGFTKSTKKIKNPMIFGLRVTISPTSRLRLEAIRVSQWGGNGYNNNPTTILKSFFGDTNNGKNSSINQIAGLGFSYSLKKSIMPIRIYGQAVGEDEAGNLPSCFMYQAGAEVEDSLIGHKSKIGIEFIDTRIDYTTNGFCGPNTAYNNTNYKFTNHGIVMGAPIDTEGKSIDFFGMTEITKNLSANFNVKKVYVNTNNWSEHRLSSKSEEGWLKTIGLTLKKDNILLYGNLNTQNFTMNKINSAKGIGIYFGSAINF